MTLRDPLMDKWMLVHFMFILTVQYTAVTNIFTHYSCSGIIPPLNLHAWNACLHAHEVER